MRPTGYIPTVRRVAGAGRGPLLVVAAVLLLGLAAQLVPNPRYSPRLAAAARGAPTEGLPWLSVRDGRVVDDLGRAVLLRGYNDDALVEYAGSPAAPLDEVDAEMMRRTGADVVRLPISWSLLEPVRGRIETAYVDRIVATVDMLNRHGLYVVPDMHFYPNWGPSYGGAGAPRWATFPGLPDIPAVKEDNVRKNLSPAANAAEVYFWSTPDWQDDYIAAWRAVAAALRDHSGVAGYDLFNEPRPGPLPPPFFERAWMWPLMSRTIEAMAAVDPNHAWVVEATLFADLPTFTVPLPVPNLLYSPHFYTGTLVPPKFTGDRLRIDAEMAMRQREAAELDAALWVGELGDDHNAPYGPEWADAVLDSADDLGAGWAWWQWRQDDDNWRIRSLDGSGYDTTFLPHVARPYVVAAPRGVRGGRGDGVRGRLTIRVDAAHADQPVVVAWPS
ncbi:MAG: endoglycosylceramidase, partial [Chloroflexota bacterium]|nr:endoglycosylceramidase [Chloroflexota bacterium]